MDKLIKLIETKLDKIDDRLDSIDKTLVKQEENLKLHMYRTDQNELMIKTLSDDFKPTKNHVALMNSIAKIVFFLGVLAGIYNGFFK